MEAQATCEALERIVVKRVWSINSVGIVAASILPVVSGCASGARERHLAARADVLSAGTGDQSLAYFEHEEPDRARTALVRPELKTAAVDWPIDVR